jgi:hypothetical protein
MAEIGKEGALPGDDLDFLNLLLMLGSTASVELGAKKAKGAATTIQNLPRARQIINMLVAMEKKSEGRRSPQEEQVLRSLLKDLQERYVAAAGLGKATEEISQVAHQAAQAYSKSKKAAP